jgi:signal transduction histidine kinase
MRPVTTVTITLLCCFLAVAVLAWRCMSGVQGPMLDLQVYAAGGNALRHGVDLYAIRTPGGLWFTYPPAAAIFALPLTLVPFATAKAAWAAVMVCAPLTAAVWFSFRPLLARAGALGPAVFAVILACCALLYPLAREFSFGQVDILLVALCLLDLAPGRRPWPRGLLIGVATAITLEPGVFVVYLLITRRRREAAIAAASFTACTAAAWLVSPRDSVSYWTSALFDTGRIGGSGSAQNQSLHGIILRAIEPYRTLLAPTAVWVAVALVIAALGFAVARSCWIRDDDMAGIAITGLLAALLSPVAWISHYCWLVTVLGVVIGEGRSWRRVCAAGAAGILFATTSVPTWAQGWLSRGFPVLPGRLLEDTIGLAALALMLIIYRIHCCFWEDARVKFRQASLAGALSAVRPSAARRVVPVALIVAGLFGVLLIRRYLSEDPGINIVDAYGVTLFAPGLGQDLVLPLAWGLLVSGGWLAWRSPDPALAALRARASRLTSVPRRSQRLALALVPAAMMAANLVLPWYLTLQVLPAIAAAGTAALLVAAAWPLLAARICAGAILALSVAGIPLAVTRLLFPYTTAPNMYGVVAVSSSDTRDLAVGQAVLLLALGCWLVQQLFPAARRLLHLPTDPWQRVEQLTKSRAAVADTAAADLRRLERDLHDGAQARLVALGMTLRAAEQLFPASPDQAVALVGEARHAAAQALTDLRELVRGVHPPVLADRGLADAVRALALDCPLTVQTSVEVQGRLPAPVETACYFAVAELLTNAAKHSGAREARIDVSHAAGVLRIEVMDFGLGGADAAGGSGLMGVERRLAAFDGIMTVSSPAGGPTTVVLEVPCALSSAKTSSC